ncbi:hypothetical protein [Amycolatopsis sp. NPDC057786]|uniref:hypothetical protein n=1 Tax=Amycolatopsis sp. NPDC057786 TaxID=3346250 RepID=UPI00366BA820
MLAVDLPGHGDSVRAERYSLAAMADEVADLLGERAPGPPHRNLALAGPGLPETDDIALVPRDPVTGRSWPHSGAADVVPVAAEV